MTDVLERLRADNPVPEGSPPPFDQVWGSALDRPPRRGRAAGARSMVWGALALIPVAIVGAIAITTLGHRSSSGSGGGATGAYVVHYQVRTVVQLALRGRSRSTSMVTIDDVWVSGRSAHWVSTRQFFARSGRSQVSPVEFATDGRVLASFSPPTPANPTGKLVEVEAASRPRCSLLALFCPFAPRDPAVAVRMAVDRGLLVLRARNVLLNGRHVDELIRRRGPSVEVFVAPGTFIPVELSVHSSGPLRDFGVATITGYERLPLTAANRSLLRMSQHPGATLCTALPGAGGTTRVAGPDSCFLAGARSGGGGHRPVLARPVPSAVLKSFDVLRGVAIGEPKALPNGLGWKVWAVPWRDHICLTVASPSNSLSGFSESGDCVPDSMLLAGEFSPGWFSPGETVIGLAPNGNRTVTLKLSDGSTRTVPVLDNTYAVHTYRIIRTVTLRDSAGQLQSWNVPDGTPG